MKLVLMRRADDEVPRGAFNISMWWRTFESDALPDRLTERVVDVALLIAKRPGAERVAVALRDVHKGYVAAWPTATAGLSAASFDATVGYHTINTRSRFPAPAEPRGEAPWITDPVFYRVSRGRYRLLSQGQVARFREAVAHADPEIYRDQFDAERIVGEK